MEFLTKAEKETLEQRVAALVANRPVLSKRIAEARELGDLRENGDYHAAREQQGIEEAEIRRLTERLNNLSVVDESLAKAVEGVVFVGTTVKMIEEGTDDEDLYKLVGEAGSSTIVDYVEVTVTSPMGQAMLKARVGEVIRVSAPRGEKRFRIVEIME